MNDDFNYSRRETTTVDVGGVKMGSGYPMRVQSMTNTDTNDIEASAAQCLRIAQAGGEIVRLTAQGVREAQSIGLVRRGGNGCRAHGGKACGRRHGQGGAHRLLSY